MRKFGVAILSVGLVILIFTLYVVFTNDKIKINNTDELWADYDANIQNIESNMKEITVSNESWEWWELKTTNLNDNDLLNSYNSLVAYIRMCYISATDDGTIFSDSVQVINFKDEKHITKKQLELLQIQAQNDYCLMRFDTLKYILISEDEHSNEEFLKGLSELYSLQDTELFKEHALPYEEIVKREVQKMNVISRLSDWLKTKYYEFQDS